MRPRVLSQRCEIGLPLRLADIVEIARGGGHGATLLVSTSAGLGDSRSRPYGVQLHHGRVRQTGSGYDWFD